MTKSETEHCPAMNGSCLAEAEVLLKKGDYAQAGEKFWGATAQIVRVATVDMSSSKPKVYVLLLRQDDPRKCTSVKLARFGLATPLYRIGRVPRRSLILNPLAPQILLPSDRSLAEGFGLAAVDCSWERAQEVFAKRLPGSGRRLPTLLAGNPVNYAKLHRLSSAEALAAALHIMGYRERAVELLSIFKWGGGFLALNREPLESYSSAKDRDEMMEAERQFF